MKFSHTLRKQAGELSLTLTVLGLVLSLVGVGVGSVATRSVQQKQSQADEIFTFKSTLEIRDEHNQVVNWEPGMTWRNTLTGIEGSTSGDVKSPNSSKAQLTYEATKAPGLPVTLQNKRVSVTVSVPDGYEIIGSFCEDRQGTGCKEVRHTDDRFGSRGINNIAFQKGAEIVYGLKLKSTTQPTPIPTQPTTQPTTPQSSKGNVEVQVVALNYPREVDGWDVDPVASKAPNSCARISGLPLYLSKNQLVATCVGGACTSGEKHYSDMKKNQGYTTFLDLPAGEYTFTPDSGTDDAGFELWSGCANSTFKVTPGTTTQNAVVILQTRSEGDYETMGTEGECTTSGGKPTIVRTKNNGSTIVCYKEEVTEDPTPTGSGGSELACSRECIYSENTGKCYEGRCPVNAPECGGNTPKERIVNGNKGCRYGGNSCPNAGAQEVSCTTGERINNTPPTIPSMSPTNTPTSILTITPTPRQDQINVSIDTKTGLSIYDEYGLEITADYTSGGEAITESIDRQSDMIVTMAGMPYPDDDIYFTFYYRNHFNLSPQITWLNSPIKTFRIQYHIDDLKADSFHISVPEFMNISRLGQNYLGRRQDFRGERAPIIKIALRGQNRDKGRSVKVSLANKDSDYLYNGDDADYGYEATIPGKRVKFHDISELMYPSIHFVHSDSTSRFVDFFLPRTEKYYFEITYDDFSGTRALISKCDRCINTRIIATDGNSARIEFVASSFGQTVEVLLEPRDVKLASIPPAFYGPSVVTNSSLSNTISKFNIQVCTVYDCTNIDVVDGKYDIESINNLLSKGNVVSIGCSAILEGGRQYECQKVLPSSLQRMYLSIDNESISIVGESQRADIDSDGFVSGSDLAGLLDNYLSPSGDLNGDSMTNALDYSMMLGWLGEDVIYMSTL